jgi:2-methylfumaryl-CoA isomerase
VYGLLKGLRVVEGAAFIAGPSCSLHLAQMGAEVIRFDDVRGGPDSRRWPLAPGSGASLYWEGLNKGKKSVAIDLSRPEGRELAQALATAPGENGGLFVTNYPADGFLAYEQLRPRRADLVCLRVMGWADGKPALDYTVNCAVGVPFMTGPADWPEPVNHALPAWDLLAGAYGAFALLAAERRRRETGQGGEIRLPLSDVAAASLGHLGQVAEVALGGEDRRKTGNDLYGAFGRDFVTADGHRLMVTAITPRQWSSLVEALGLTGAVADLEAELGVSFARDEGLRFTHRQRLLPLFVDAFQVRETATLTAAFDAAGVTWGPYQTLSAAVAGDARLFAGNPVFATAQHPSGGYLTPGAIATLAGEARGAPAGAPRLGQHTDEVLAELLGLSGGEIGRLRDAGLVAG